MTGRFLRPVLLALIGCVMASGAFAQPGTIRVIFPYAAGGSGDATARLLADKLQTSLGQTVLVENRTGGAGRIGVNAVKNAAADARHVIVHAVRGGDHLSVRLPLSRL